MKESGSIELSLSNLNALIISFSFTLTYLFGATANPRCASVEGYSLSKCRSSSANSKYRTLPSPLPATNKRFVLGSKKGINVPEEESMEMKPPMAPWAISSEFHRATCLSENLSKPVVTSLLVFPNQTILEALAPRWPGPSDKSSPDLTSQTLIFLSLDTVAIFVPL